LSEALDCWKLLCPGIEIPDSPSLQKLWDAPIINKKFNEILDSSDHRNKTRLLAVFELESGAWLKALPSSNLGTLLDRQHFKMLLLLELDLKSVILIFAYVGGSQVDKWGSSLSFVFKKCWYNSTLQYDILKRRYLFFS
jgi:hypothetical protein